MDNDHGITGELREWFEDRVFMANGWQELHAIADRIDAAYNAAYQDGENAILAVFDKRGNADVDERMAEHGWYRALDGDKQPIRIGDEVDSDHHEDGTVTGVQFYEMANVGIRTLVAVRPDGWDVATWYAPDEYRHHHEPTVEDVLREMLDAWGELPSNMTNEAIIAEYAKRLRLAGDAE